eukprot:TRINITY_DN4516_c0_g3_i1.p1 TRINITY_DN4516_c0_g3~~TRINITY_DN4516_c0_g3_i1.p1  ORF type:complete len:324 (-),score=122.13 TRINITY_DN4516_c0_g3_i1:20-925(-)
MQSTNNILMINPIYFASNPQTLIDNTFMKVSEQLSISEIRSKVQQEFQNLVIKIRNEGIQVNVFNHSEDTPDACFPNNWFSTHSNLNGKRTLVLYPMKAANRALERNNIEARKFLSENYECLIDFSHYEPLALEGTGSIIFDHINKKAYCSLSERSNLNIAENCMKQLNFSSITFPASYSNIPIYHTNILLSIGSKFAVICPNVIDINFRQIIINELQFSGKIIIEITVEQCLENMCGNILELKGKDGLIVVMSQKALNAFNENQKQLFYDAGIVNFISSDIKTIEEIGGGSARCMIAELF